MHLVDEWISRLDDDRARIRSDASSRILHWAQHSSVQQRDELKQSLLRAGLTADLDLQMSLDRLVEQIHEAEYARALNGFLNRSEFSDDRLASRWQTFASRASNRNDSREVFARVARQAGPSLTFPTIGAFHPKRVETTVMVSHLGCVAPNQPHFFLPESDVVYARLIANRQRDEPTPGATEEARVLDRLLDATIINNPYGWSVEQRLRLALLYQRHSTAVGIADAVMRPKDRLPIDWIAAMLAMRQVERQSGWIGSHILTSNAIDWPDRIGAIVESLDDSRTLAVHPEARWVPVLRKRKPPRANAGIGLQAQVLRTRVQDIATWILLDRQNLDARKHGMPQLEADLVWGVHRASVGFSSDHERQLAIDQVRRQITSR